MSLSDDLYSLFCQNYFSFTHFPLAHVPRWHTTWWRLHAGGGFTTVWTRAGVAVRHGVSDETHPRLRETAR